MSAIGSRLARISSPPTTSRRSRGNTTRSRSTWTKPRRRSRISACCAHALHDGYTDLIYVMLPIWQAEFALSYAAIGALRAVFAGTMAGFQIPSGLLSERFGTPLVLAVGTALAGLGYCLAPLVDS